MAIFWSSKGDRVKRLLVRRCSHSAQQRQREQLNAGLAVGHPKYPLECTLPSYRFHHVEARSCTRAKPELAAAVLTHCGASSNRRSVEKRLKSEPPVVFFPLDPKKRHLHWATWWVFGSSETGGLCEDPKKRHLPKDKTGGASALPFTRPFSRWHCVRRGKVEGPGGNYGFADRSTPELPAFVHNRIAFDSLYCGIHIRISV